jgi:type I restriction enzyme M protein
MSEEIKAYIGDQNGQPVAFYPALKRTRPAGPSNAEEPVRVAAYNELIDRYGYSPSRIDIEVPVYIREDEQPRYADIVVFADDAKRRPFLVVETKRPNRVEGEKQGQRYATILRAVYVLWTNGSDRSTSVVVNRYPEDCAPIADLPSFGGQPSFSVSELRPLGDDHEIRKVFRKCHNEIRSSSHLNPDAAFTEFLKILLVKIADEARDKEYQCQVFLAGAPPCEEPPNETAQRVRFLFNEKVEEDQDVASTFKSGEDIALTNECIAKVVRWLQEHSFTATEVDQKGRAFETFLSGDLRQEFKEFMTPRPVVSMVVAMADPDATASILDPCCGTGAFLIESLRYVREKINKKRLGQHQKIKQAFDFAHDKLWGFDASVQMSAVARINMLVNEDGRAHVFHHDSLLPRTEATRQARTRQFDFVFTNPPFGARVSAPSSLLEHFGIVCDDSGSPPRTGSYLTEVLFVERDLEWLKPGGMLFIVLPDSVLGNSTLVRQRRFIEQHARLLGVISLTADTFGPSGAKNKTSVVIWEKRPVPLDSHEGGDGYHVFLAHAHDVGYDFTGRATGVNDLPEIREAFLKFRADQPVESKKARVVEREALDWMWSAPFHLGSGALGAGTGEAAEGTSTISELCTFVGTGKTAARKDYTDAGVHMVKVGNLTGRGIEFGSVDRQYVREEWAAKYPDAHLEPGDILFTASSHGPKWIGLKVDIFESPPDFVTQGVICCGEIMICRPDPERVDPYYLLAYVRSPAGYDAIQRCIRGQSGHIYPGEINEIAVPNPGNFTSDAVDEVISASKAALRLKADAAEAQRSAELAGRTLFPSDRQKPIVVR